MLALEAEFAGKVKRVFIDPPYNTGSAFTHYDGGKHKKLNALLDLAVERFKALGEEDQNLFKGKLVSFRNLYGFISQIIPYQDSDHDLQDLTGRQNHQDHLKV